VVKMRDLQGPLISLKITELRFENASAMKRSSAGAPTARGSRHHQTLQSQPPQLPLISVEDQVLAGVWCAFRDDHGAGQAQ
jgi:hypothetical protein